MHAFGSHFLRFLPFRHRSTRSQSPPATPRDGTAASPSPKSTSSPALCPCPTSAHHASGLAVHTTTGTSHSPVLNPTGRLCGDRAMEDSNGRPSQVPRPVALVRAGNSTRASKLSSPDSFSLPPVHLSHPPNLQDPTQFQNPPLEPVLHRYLDCERDSISAAKDLPPSLHQNQGIFNNARDFSVVGASFIDNSTGSITVTNNYINQNSFMEKLLSETIPGAASDSSARDPPPRCHPGTRLAILERCLNFIAHCDGVKKMRWVFGAAGVGKSAVMQNVAESPQLSVVSKASVFLSVNGRDDGTKTIITLSYQFAAKSQSYRWIIEDEVNRDPSLLHSSMATQFEKLIVRPFICNPSLNSAGRVLIIVDGLDECQNTRTQVELLHLISNFCLSSPSSPLVWLITSRPEPHIISFFSKSEVMPAYEKEEIPVESDEARADVERFLRHELIEIRRASNVLDCHWPIEQDLWKLASAAGGLFAYAHTAVRYIGDSNVGDPALQLSDVLNVIDELPIHGVPREEHPMALLDALYARILSNIPSKIMVYARKLLLALASGWDSAFRNGKNFIVLCNWLGITADEAYAALNRLRSVLKFPQRHEAHKEAPKAFHKSFMDHLTRSGFYTNMELEALQLMIQCALRVLEEAPNGIDIDFGDYSFRYGMLARHRGAGDKISITWSAQDGMAWDDARTRLRMYQLAIGEVVKGIKRGDLVFQRAPYIKLLTTGFKILDNEFPSDELRDLVLDESRYHEWMKHGVLKQIPAKAIPVLNIAQNRLVKMRFHRRVTTTLPDTFESSCKHNREGRYEPGKEQNWTTAFTYRSCTFCFDRLKCQLESWMNWYPDRTVPIMFTSAYYCCIQVKFVDAKDGISEWTYWFWLYLSPEVRKKLENSM